MMTRLAILTSFVLAACLGNTTPPEGGIAPSKGTHTVPDIRAQITEEMGLSATSTTVDIISVHEGVVTYQAVTTFAGGGGETCEVDAVDAEILATRCTDLVRE
jgi:hypothetical protein